MGNPSPRPYLTNDIFCKEFRLHDATVKFSVAQRRYSNYRYFTKHYLFILSAKNTYIHCRINETTPSKGKEKLHLEVYLNSYKDTYPVIADQFYRIIAQYIPRFMTDKYKTHAILRAIREKLKGYRESR